jgi:hypothetical protein
MADSIQVDDDVFARHLTDYVEGAVDDAALMAAHQRHCARSEKAQRLVKEAQQFNTAMKGALQPLAPSGKFDAQVMEKVRRTSSIISAPLPAVRDDSAAEEPKTVPVMAVRRDWTGAAMKLWPLYLFAAAVAAALMAMLSKGETVASFDDKPEGARVEAFHRGQWRQVDRKVIYSGDRLYAPANAWTVRLSGADASTRAFTLSGGSVQVERRGDATVLYPMQPDRPLAVKRSSGPAVAVTVGQVTVDNITDSVTVAFNQFGAVSVNIPDGAASESSVRVTTAGFPPVQLDGNDSRIIAEQDRAPSKTSKR